MRAKVIILAKSLIPNFFRACAIVHWGWRFGRRGPKKVTERSSGMIEDGEDCNVWCGEGDASLISVYCSNWVRHGIVWYGMVYCSNWVWHSMVRHGMVQGGIVMVYCSNRGQRPCRPAELVAPIPCLSYNVAPLHMMKCHHTTIPYIPTHTCYTLLYFYYTSHIMAYHKRYCHPIPYDVIPYKNCHWTKLSKRDDLECNWSFSAAHSLYPLVSSVQIF